MRRTFLLIALSLALSACAQTVAPNPESTTSTGSLLSGTGMTDSPNEATPKTSDSLEVASNSAAILYVLTESGTIVEGSNRNAPRLIMFTDYDCVYCKRFVLGDLRWMERNMVQNGTLTLERVLLPVSTRGEQAAQLAVCSAEQQKFTEADLYLSTHALPVQDIAKFAKAVGVNPKKLAQCVTRKNLLAGNLKKAEEYGAERVPFFVLGSDSWLGLMQREELQEKIENDLKQ